QAGSIVEAGVGEEEIVAGADGAGVGVVSTQNGVAMDRVGLGQKPARGGGQGEGGGGARGGLKKAAASEHGGTSVTPGKLARKTTYECGGSSHRVCKRRRGQVVVPAGKPAFTPVAALDTSCFSHRAAQNGKSRQDRSR